MLYVTTRSNRDAFTPNRVLLGSRGPDGGPYVPFRLPVLSEAEIENLGSCSFSENVARILNLFFNTKLTGWDVEFCIGRSCVRMKNIGHRAAAVESWHNPGWTFSHAVGELAHHIAVKTSDAKLSSDWIEIASRIAILFGVFGELSCTGELPASAQVDVSVVSGTFSAPVSLWYARAMGLPIGNIVCCCNENSNLWELFHHGQFRTDCVAVPTLLPEADITLPVSLERLIYSCGGHLSANRFVDCCRKGKTYYPPDSVLHLMQKGMYVAVVSQARTDATICSVYGAGGYLLSPYAAMAYSGLLDYRSHTGNSRHALVLSEKSPVLDAGVAAKALQISEENVRRLADDR